MKKRKIIIVIVLIGILFVLLDFTFYFYEDVTHYNFSLGIELTYNTFDEHAFVFQSDLFGYLILFIVQLLWISKNRKAAVYYFVLALLGLSIATRLLNLCFFIFDISHIIIFDVSIVVLILEVYFMKKNIIDN